MEEVESSLVVCFFFHLNTFLLRFWGLPAPDFYGTKNHAFGMERMCDTGACWWAWMQDCRDLNPLIYMWSWRIMSGLVSGREGRVAPKICIPQSSDIQVISCCLDIVQRGAGVIFTFCVLVHVIFQLQIFGLPRTRLKYHVHARSRRWERKQKAILSAEIKQQPKHVASTSHSGLWRWRRSNQSSAFASRGKCFHCTELELKRRIFSPCGHKQLHW